MVLRRSSRPSLGLRLLPDAPTRSGLSYVALGVLWSLLARAEGEEVATDRLPPAAVEELLAAGYIKREGSMLLVSEEP